MLTLPWNAFPVAHTPSFFLMPVTPAAACCMASMNFSYTLHGAKDKGQGDYGGVLKRISFVYEVKILNVRGTWTVH